MTIEEPEDLTELLERVARRMNAMGALALPVLEVLDKMPAETVRGIERTVIPFSTAIRAFEADCKLLKAGVDRMMERIREAEAAERRLMN